ncbi:baculoviral IAP repeat-containing protein 7 [Microcaecilia unicolor]|uniref:RING-type E3 ubiquitin transferase n=1 Tax=Microcaecilia unicolor TaxID=1415580 RepID=A0A6P7YPB1_9AMPH|nr:baculoviral IAP repeat-containing protein 7 [Microcaecilia unicolor]XP_030069124.1 baculoviral IAP repeat-containing protein 7 [Microcaecilia unicolor]XP_030069126.1 baculoviral IAP repeat-containing protein 7 [Microcaecilia unicolor]XP_030069127.1 baculoviral IAP repeat-containing protein 7 [Microcaecilia unicolor]XP_030069128.1 baculoviral IAP repeat-containing protein 7 [Microcaecilia unicolor]XP_030069129.1 baculoviral IAP repeat-containing protein 7 [Microcaecilia unicolor]
MELTFPCDISLENPSMRSEVRRLQTFNHWPPAFPVKAADLARAGFHFRGPWDRVQCFCCGGVLRSWEDGDHPLLEHKRFFPMCAFIVGKDVGNIPMSPPWEFSDSVDGQMMAEEDTALVTLTKKPVHSRMETEHARLATFWNWPSYAKVYPEELVRAGFFYVGHSDHVKCFYCDGGLRHWEHEDDPWWEHAKWFPSCEFVLQALGREFISQTQDSVFSTPVSLRSSPQPAERDFTSPLDTEDLACLQQSSVVQAALHMGFSPSTVDWLVQNKYMTSGVNYTAVSELVSDLVQMEQESNPEGNGESPAARAEAKPKCPREKDLQLSTEEQLQRLQEARTCKVCMDSSVSIVFIPCGHLVVCAECSPKLQHCPVCRATICDTVRTFMS